MSVPKASGVIQLAIVYIKDDNIKGLQQVLGVMPLDQIGPRAENLLSTFLSVCAGYDRADAAKVILDAWKVIYPEEEKMQLLSRLFLINQINLPTLSFIILSHKDFTYVELMDDLIAGDSSPQVTTACNKADKIFGIQPHDTYEIVQKHAYDLDNDRVYDYATVKMEETASYAPIPGWVKNYMNGPLVTESELMRQPDIGDVPFEIPPDEEAVELLTKGLTHLGISVGELDKARQYLLRQLSVSTRGEKIQMLKSVMENQANKILVSDKLLYQIFGPANPLIDQDLTLNTPSSKYGGCRMFLCDVFDYDEEFDYVTDWFRGVCDQCHLKIRHRWHAVRRPRPHGGWVGGYCSWECATRSIHWDGEEPDMLTRELIKIFKKQTNEIGIQDRLPDDTPDIR